MKETANKLIVAQHTAVDPIQIFNIIINPPIKTDITLSYLQKIVKQKKNSITRVYSTLNISLTCLALKLILIVSPLFKNGNLLILILIEAR